MEEPRFVNKISRMKKLLLFGLVFLMMISGAYAISTTNNDLYYSFDDDDLTGSNPQDLTGNYPDGTTSGATTGQTGLINEAFYFDGINDYVDSNFQPRTVYPYDVR